MNEKTKQKTTEAECYKCGYKWTPRKQQPKACPRCKTRLDIKYGGE